MGRATTIHIFGQTYSIDAELDEAYIQKCAALVDERMRAIARSSPMLDTQRVAVLAALTIADKFYGAEEEREENEDLLRARAQNCLAIVERALKNDSA